MALKRPISRPNTVGRPIATAAWAGLAMLFALGPVAAVAAQTDQQLGESKPAPTLQRAWICMGTQVRLQLWMQDREQALAASERAREVMAVAEARLSNWDPDSEVSRWNAAPVGRPVPLSDPLHRELQAALALREATRGAFDPMVGGWIDAWDLRGAGRVPTEPERLAARRAALHANLRSTAGGWVRDTDATLATGGFGKGAALDDAARNLRAAGVQRAHIDLGGQWLFVGGEADRFAVTVARPSQRTTACLSLRVPSGSLATSGNSERSIEVGGKRVGHLLDPRTGWPAPNFGSVTVWCRDALQADALATALFVMGPEAGLAWAQRTEGVEALFLVKTQTGLRALATRQMRRWVTDSAPFTTWQEAVSTPPSSTPSSQS